jgi:hypothetical protein
MLIRKLLSLFVDLDPVMMDVEKVPWHFSINERKRICSSGLALLSAAARWRPCKTEVDKKY